NWSWIGEVSIREGAAVAVPRVVRVPLMKRLFATCIVLLAAGAVRAAPPPDSRPLVWIVDGAGDLRGCSNGFTTANMLAGGPMELTVFPWSHGYRRILLDQVDAKHAKMQ